MHSLEVNIRAGIEYIGWSGLELNIWPGMLECNQGAGIK
jgi:hypothetical protein